VAACLCVFSYHKIAVDVGVNGGGNDAHEVDRDDDREKGLLAQFLRPNFKLLEIVM